MPAWLHYLSIASLVLAFGCAAWIALDVRRRPQPMWIMNVVWPVSALFGSALWLWFYRRHGRASAERSVSSGGERDGASSDGDKPFPAMVAEGATHCGAGCTLGDIVAEWLAFFVPAVAVWFGYGSVFSDKIFAVWVLDFVVAFALGVVFQYFTIAPMRNLGLRDGLVAAVKADTLSLTAWQVGMYGFMAFAHFVLFGRWLGIALETDTWAFWFMMQVAMLCGFATSYPVNWWLLRAGLKEKM